MPATSTARRHPPLIVNHRPAPPACRAQPKHSRKKKKKWGAGVGGPTQALSPCAPTWQASHIPGRCQDPVPQLPTYTPREKSESCLRPEEASKPRGVKGRISALPLWVTLGKSFNSLSICLLARQPHTSSTSAVRLQMQSWKAPSLAVGGPRPSGSFPLPSSPPGPTVGPQPSLRCLPPLPHQHNLR